LRAFFSKIGKQKLLNFEQNQFKVRNYKTQCKVKAVVESPCSR